MTSSSSKPSARRTTTTRTYPAPATCPTTASTSSLPTCCPTRTHTSSSTARTPPARTRSWPAGALSSSATRTCTSTWRASRTGSRPAFPSSKRSGRRAVRAPPCCTARTVRKDQLRRRHVTSWRRLVPPPVADHDDDDSEPAWPYPAADLITVGRARCERPAVSRLAPRSLVRSERDPVAGGVGDGRGAAAQRVVGAADQRSAVRESQRDGGVEVGGVDEGQAEAGDVERVRTARLLQGERSRCAGRPKHGVAVAQLHDFEAEHVAVELNRSVDVIHRELDVRHAIGPDHVSSVVTVAIRTLSSPCPGLPCAAWSSGSSDLWSSSTTMGPRRR